MTTNVRAWWSDGPWLVLNLWRVTVNVYPCGWKRPRLTVKRWVVRYHGGLHVEVMAR